MKRIDIFVPHEHLTRVNKILYECNVGGMTFYDIKGRGRTKPSPVSVGRGVMSYVPEFAYWTKIEVVVSDDSAKVIVKKLIDQLGAGPEAMGKVFVYDALEAYDIGTKKEGNTSL